MTDPGTAGGGTGKGTGELSLTRTASAILRGRRVIVQLAVAGALIGLVSGLLRDRSYVSRLSFLPKGAEESSSGLALAASQFGVTLPARSSDWWPAVYVELLNSRALLEPIVVDTFVVAEEDGRRATLMDLLEVQGREHSVRVARTVLALREVVAATEDKKLGAVKVSVATQWPSVSLALAERLVTGVHRFNIETRQTLASAERQFVDIQSAEAERALRDAEDRLQVFLQRNRVVDSPELTVAKERLQRDVTLRMQMYTSLLQSREQARLREVRNTPVITMVEGPRIPVLPARRGASLRAALGLVAGALLGILYAIGVRQLDLVSRSRDPDVVELLQLWREATPRLLRRWVGL